jgi:hypothetical protein
VEAKPGQFGAHHMSDFRFDMDSGALRRANKVALKAARDAELSIGAALARFPSFLRPRGDVNILLRAAYTAAYEGCDPASEQSRHVAAIAARAAVKQIFVERDLVAWSLQALRREALVSTRLLRFGAFLLPRSVRGR